MKQNKHTQGLKGHTYDCCTFHLIVKISWEVVTNLPAAHLPFQMRILTSGRPVTPKSVPPKIGPAGLILAGKSAKTGPNGPLLLPNLVRPDRFWLPKMVPSCQNQSPMGDRFWQKIIRQNRSPSKWHSYSCAHMATWMQLLYHLAMHGYLASLYPII